MKCHGCGTEMRECHRYSICEACHYCCADCEEKVEDAAYRQLISICDCGSALQRQTPPVDDKHYVFIHVDNSNVHEGGKKKDDSCSKYNPSVRLDTKKMMDVFAKNRRVARATVYGSVSPNCPSGPSAVFKSYEEAGFEVNIHERSFLTGAEKQVDTQLVSDVTETVCSRKYVKGIIVIVSGDEDVIPAVEKGLIRKFSFEIWSWKDSLSSKLVEISRENPDLVKIFLLDRVAGEILFTVKKDQRCWFGVKCWSGLNCGYKHTQEEQDHFSKHCFTKAVEDE